MILHMLLHNFTASLCQPSAFRLASRPWALSLPTTAAVSQQFLQQCHKHSLDGKSQRTERGSGFNHTEITARRKEPTFLARPRSPVLEPPFKQHRVPKRVINARQLEKQRFRDAMNRRDIVAVFSRYPSTKVFFEPEDTYALVRLLHTFIRKSDEGADVEWLLGCANILVRDLLDKTLAPHAEASKHLLSIFREAGKFTEGRAFWNWLLKQDSRHLNIKTWGAGIELLAYAGLPLEDLEDLFTEALERFPASFAAYHLSPNAVLPDRNLPFPQIKGISLGLLQGIITGRLLHKDLKGAYLALDTAFRILPTAVPKETIRAFHKERPLVEKYKIFMMACRSRNAPPPASLQDILEDIAAEIRNAPYNDELVEKLIRRIGASLKAVLAYVAIGGKLDEGHINSVMLLLNRLMGQYPSGDVDVDPAWKRFHDEVFRSADDILAYLLPFVHIPALTAHHGLMGIASQSGNFDLVLQTFQKLQERGRTPSHNTYRLMVRLAGSCQDFTSVRCAWEMLIKDAEASKRTVDHQDRRALIDATAFLRSSTSVVDFVQAEAHRYNWDTAIPKVRHRPIANPGPISFSEMSSSLKSAIKVALDVPGNYFTSLDGFYSHLLNTSIDSIEDLGPMDELRNIYDQLTADPSQPQTGFTSLGPGTGEPGNIIYDGVPLGKLRFENWVTITELLELAEHQSRLEDKIIDQAIEHKVPLSQIRSDNLRDVGAFVDQDTRINREQAPGSNSACRRYKSGEELRQHIYRLRGLR